MLQELVDNDGLIRHSAGDAIGGKEIDRIEHINLQIRPQLVNGGSIQQRAAISVVDVFPDQHMSCGGDLPLELNHLVLNCSFFLLRVGAHTRVQRCSFHILH